jgi:uncharacterized membrane protein
LADGETCRFLLQVRDGATLGAAAATALEMNAQVDIASGLAKLIGAGAFAALDGRQSSCC